MEETKTNRSEAKGNLRLDNSYSLLITSRHSMETPTALIELEISEILLFFMINCHGNAAEDHSFVLQTIKCLVSETKGTAGLTAGQEVALHSRLPQRFSHRVSHSHLSALPRLSIRGRRALLPGPSMAARLPPETLLPVSPGPGAHRRWVPPSSWINRSDRKSVD